MNSNMTLREQANRNQHPTVRARLMQRYGAPAPSPKAIPASVLDAFCPEVLHERKTYTVPDYEPATCAEWFV